VRRKSKEMNYLFLRFKQLRKVTFVPFALTIMLVSCEGHSPKATSNQKQQIAESDVVETKNDKKEKAQPEAKQTPKEIIIPPAILPGPEPEPYPEPYPYPYPYPDPYPFPEPPGPVLPDGPCPTVGENPDPYDSFEVDVQPEYPGGMQALVSYISEHLTYPPDAMENGIEGRVFVRFTVLKTGETTDFKILRGLSPSLDREVIRMLKGMEKWKPGILKDQPVDVYFTIPVKLSLD
jgi:TonB family protein